MWVLYNPCVCDVQIEVYAAILNIAINLDIHAKALIYAIQEEVFSFLKMFIIKGTGA